MKPSELFEDAVPLAKDKHRDAYLETGLGYEFARNLSFVPVSISEIPELLNNYAVAFLEIGDSVSLIALLGSKENENVFVSSDGSWAADYTPLILRLYPFVAKVRDPSDPDTKLLNVVEGHSGFNMERKGVALFNENGDLSEFTSQIKEMVSRATNDSLKCKAVCKKLKELNLLSPFSAVIKNESGEEKKLSGFSVVNRKTLNNLTGETLIELQRSGVLEVIYLHLSTLRNLRSLASRSFGHFRRNPIETFQV